MVTFEIEDAKRDYGNMLTFVKEIKKLLLTRM
jgi:hypothetical protein